MRLSLAVAVLLPLSAPVWAQAQTQNNGDSVIAVPLAPPIVAAPPTPAAPVAPLAPPPPGLVQNPVPPAQAAPVPAPAAPPDVAPVIPNVWVPGKVATLGVLNEVDGGTSTVSIPVGGQSAIGDLQVSVQACATRPPDQLPDAAIFLTVTPSGNAAAAALYRGWMVRSAPGATVVGDSSEAFRIIGCS
jgi:hypothetical protein